MLKSVGLLLILIAGAGMGFSKSRELAGEQRALEQIRKMILFLKREISYKNSPLSEAFLDISVKIPGEYASFSRSLAEEIRKHGRESFGEIFRRNARRYLKDTGLSKEEREWLYSLGEHLGYLDRDMQIRQLTIYEKEVEDSIEELKAKLPEKTRVYRSLGILCGILLAVLMW